MFNVKLNFYKILKRKKMKNMIDNEITVLVSSDEAILKFPKCALEVSAFIGKNGLTSNKQEGDDCTPIGKFDLGLLLGTHDKIFNKNYDYTKISSDMYWVDDSNSIYYNKLVDVTKVEKDWNSAEHLIDYPIQYEYLVEIKSNPTNIPNKGSAIFLHCSNNTATHGCIAINKKDMEKLVNNIDKNTKINIIEIK